jgi:acyl-CoA synthetase (AMP-forming)/AMP-acid ligase II/thioesterase domain-containing protein/acyl carrier protein
LPTAGDRYARIKIRHFWRKSNGMTLYTLVNLLRSRASHYPNKVAYTFLKDGEHESDTLTYRQLDEKARAIAAYLQAQLSPGDRVLLVYPQGLEAIAALFGCLYAGMIAIPAPAPETSRLKRTLPRLEAIAADAGASLILTSASLLTKRDGNLTFQARSFVGRIKGRSSLLLHYYLTAAETIQKTSQLATLPWTAAETIPSHLAAHWQPPDISGSTLAYLQYTSGSTSTPKGVMLEHANLMGHLAALQQACGYDYNSVTVTWMPYFHDYGLVEGILEPLFNGTPCYLMSPTAFIKQPLRWLKAISKYGATHSQAPNFAYAYCLRRITTAERDTLDFSQWQAAGNAAEPINPEVMEQFCQMFESCGFARHAFAPAYGLAEATLLVTTSRKADTPIFCTIDVEALAQNRIVETATGQRLAGSGQLLGETQVVIVHPESPTRCAPDEIGEIWVSSVGVARGYWQRSDATQETFCAALEGTGEGAFLRTGDLGFIKEGELFVTGRLKDLIIIRGENYYPQDLERVVEKSHPTLRPGCGAAFAIAGTDTEQIVVLQEVESNSSENLNFDEIISEIRNAVAAAYELSAHAVVLLKRDSIPKTSSGKIQRQACRNTFLDGSLNSLAIWTLENLSDQQKITPENPLEAQLLQIWRRVLGISAISTKDNFFELGGDSLKAAIVVAEIEQAFGQTISLVSLVEASTIEKLANFIIQGKREVKLRSLVSIKPTGYKRPFFDVHGLGGHSLAPTLARYLDPERPVYGLQAIGLDGVQAPYTRIEEMVAHYIQEIQTVQPEGPYLLGGLCIGGNVAFEMAQELKKQGQQVLLVAMLDSQNPYWTEAERIEMANLPSNYQLSRKEELMGSGFSLKQIENLFRVQDANYQLLVNHIPQVYSGRVVYFSVAEKIKFEDRAITQRARHSFDPLQPNGWNSLVAGGIEVHEVPGHHQNFFKEPHIRVLAEKLNACLEQADYEEDKLGST